MAKLNKTTVTVRQTGSPIRRKKDQRATLRGPGPEPLGRERPWRTPPRSAA